MNWIVKPIKWIMLIAGFLTASMFYYAIAPDAALRSAFGQGLEGPLAELIVRNWGVLVGLVGLMLIYGAFVPPARRLVLSVAALSKAAFVTLLLTVGHDYLGQRIGLALWVDGLEVLLFLTYLLSTRHMARPQPTGAAPVR
jgi:hypothetical protein